MKLNEVALDKADMIASMINKLLDRGVTVTLHTVGEDGIPMFGIVLGISIPRRSKRWELSFKERLKTGELESMPNSTRTSVWELEHATLKKQPDGSYLFTLPNENAQ